MNKISQERKVQIVNALCQGMSLRAITRLLDVHRTTTMNVLVEAGHRCTGLMNQKMRHLDLTHLQVDEIWTFVGKKQGRLLPNEKNSLRLGDQYLYYAIDEQTKLAPVWELGKRDRVTTIRFMHNLKASLNGCDPLISTDSFPAYPVAVETAFGPQANHVSIMKLYKSVPSGRGRYAPPKVSSIQKFTESGNPDLMDFASTSHIERANLTLRTMQRRFTRLSLGFSKKIENLRAAVALHFAYYNFCWVPRTTKITPAMAAGLTDRVWTIADILSV